MLLDESGNVDTSKFNTLAPGSPRGTSKKGSRSPVASFPAKSVPIQTSIQEEIGMDNWNEQLLEMSLENSDRFISYNQSPRSPIASDFTDISKNQNMQAKMMLSDEAIN